MLHLMELAACLTTIDLSTHATVHVVDLSAPWFQAAEG
jgi:hypothetical protein